MEYLKDVLDLEIILCHFAQDVWDVVSGIFFH